MCQAAKRCEAGPAGCPARRRAAQPGQPGGSGSPCSQRRRFGRLPVCTAQRSSGAASPSSWMMSRPGGRSRRGTSSAARAIRRRTWPRKTSSLPASASQFTSAASAAASQATPAAESTPPCTLTPGASRSAMYITSACRQTPSTRASTPPNATASATSSGRSSMPTSATNRTSTTSAHGPPVAVTPGRIQKVAASTVNEVRKLRTSERAQATVNRQSRRVAAPSRSWRRTAAVSDRTRNPLAGAHPPPAPHPGFHMIGPSATEIRPDGPRAAARQGPGTATLSAWPPSR